MVVMPFNFILFQKHFQNLYNFRKKNLDRGLKGPNLVIRLKFQNLEDHRTLGDCSESKTLNRNLQFDITWV